MLKNIIALYRPKDHVFFTIPLVILGYCVAARGESVKPALLPLLLVIFANIFALSFAFAINEIEDAEDDKKDKQRSNVVARGSFTLSIATLFTTVAFVVSFFLFSMTNIIAARTGISILIISFLYSFKPVRLKSIPILDLVSHGLMLSGLIFLSSYFVISINLIAALPIFLGVTLISFYGQFYNQIRDLKEDKMAKIKNTTILIGANMAKKAMYLSAIIGILLIAYTFYVHPLPLLLIALTAFLIPLTWFFRKYTSSRDWRAKVATTELHTPFLIIVNAFAIIFFLYLYI